MSGGANAMRPRLSTVGATVLLTCAAASLAAQAPAPAAAPTQAPAPPPGPPRLTPEQQAERARIQEESRVDHADMMKQLGITKLRPGRNSRADAENPANYDEALANPYPNLPDVLTLKNGTKVTT